MKNWKGLLFALALVAVAVPALAQETVIGVYWDTDATEFVATLGGGTGTFHTAYVMVKDAEQVVGGMAFKLVLDPRILLVHTAYPNAINVGDPLAGVQVALLDPAIAFFGVPAQACVLTLTTLDELMTNAPLTITNHPGYPEPVIANALGEQRYVGGWTSYLTVPVPADDTSWGEMKTLFR